jgi:hypothetical protein
MTDLKQTIASGLIARYKKLAGVVHELATPLSDEQFWAKPFAFGNSFGHLVLHLTGNLNYYIGAQIAGTGYVRDRPLEFSDAGRPSKKEVLKKFADAIEMVLAAISRQSGQRNIRRWARTPATGSRWLCSARRICITTLGR